MLPHAPPTPPGRRAPRPGLAAGVACLVGLAILLVAHHALAGLVHQQNQPADTLVTLLVAVLLGITATRMLVAAAFQGTVGTPVGTWRPAVTWGLYLLIGLAIVSALNLNLSGFLVGSAVIGVIVGVAAQTSLANLFAGFILLVAHPYRVGTWVHLRTYLFGAPQFGATDFSGVVMQIGSFYTVLEIDGQPVHIPNAAALNSALTASTVPVRLDIEVHLPPDADLAGLQRRLEEHLRLRPRDRVTLQPLRLITGDGARLETHLRIRSHRPVDTAVVGRILTGQPPGRRPARGAPASTEPEAPGVTPPPPDGPVDG
ncbi:MAG TPA: mechanosensitive ion channel family protein [Candidatus Dormibacteraeota bacterium]|nr:mechanosensitive ion channel family protein [Candidatus Dormibacteraeota bacterium]